VPRFDASGLRDIALRAVPGGWRVSACADGGDYELRRVLAP
jgi:hypothetical protein